MGDRNIPENDDPSKDPKRKASSNDPKWKYGFWPNLSNKNLVECTLCHKQINGGIGRFKRHLAGGFGDVTKCPKTTTEVSREMHQYLNKNKRKKSTLLDGEDDHEVDDDDMPVDDRPMGSSIASNPSITHPSSGTNAKRRQAGLKLTQPQLQSVANMIRKTPEEVVEERHTKGPTQRTMERSVKTKEDEERVHMHINDFFIENGIAFNAANSRSFEIMIESIGQYGPGLRPPSYHELRVPLLKKAKEETFKLRKEHEKVWSKNGCTLMSDGWTDTRGRHLINFLANSPEGTFFLGSVDASSQVNDVSMLADILEEKIDEIGRDRVVQVVTDNGSNYKAAGKILESRIPRLFWTPCAAHCFDLMLEDIGKLAYFKRTIENARCVTKFIYRHVRLHTALKEKTNGKEIVRPGVTRFATTFLTLQSMYKHNHALRSLFVSEDWSESKLSNTEAGKKVCDIVLSSRFWEVVEDCIRASQPLLIVLRIVDGDERPAMAEVIAAMDVAMEKVKECFSTKPTLQNKVMDIIENRWVNQMEQKIYFLNPGKYFLLKEKDETYASKLRVLFNEVVEKMTIGDERVQMKIIQQVAEYDDIRGGFAKNIPIKQRTLMSPLDWWNAFGGYTPELLTFARRIVGLCCSSSGCERNWSTFSFIHTKKRNRLEHQRLNDLVYVKYNRKIVNRFKRRREEGNNFNPLVLEEFQWNNEWVDANEEVVHAGDDLLWSHVDEATGASNNLEGRDLRGRSGTIATTNTSSAEIVYRRRGASNTASVVDDLETEVDVFPNDDEDVDDDYGRVSPPLYDTPMEENRHDGITLDDDI